MNSPWLQRFFHASIVLWACTSFGGSWFVTGEEPEFWKDRAIVVVQVVHSEFGNPATLVDMDILGVAYADIYVPSHVTVSNISNRVNPVGWFQPAPGEIYLLCLEKAGEFWRIPRCDTPLFRSHGAAKKLEGDYGKELEEMIAEIHDIRHGLAKSPVSRVLEENRKPGME